MVCGGGEVLFIVIIPFVFPHVGLVKLNVAEGIGFTTTTLVVVLTQPLAETVCITEYVPAAVKLPE